MTHQPRPLPSSRILLITLVIATFIAIGLGIAAAGDNVLPGDRAIAGALQGMDGPVVERLSTTGNLLGSTTWASVVIGVSLAIAAFVRHWSDVLFLGLLLILRLAATQLKPLFDSPRPIADLVEIHGSFDGTGYPSGHALTGATMALGFALLAWWRIPSRALAIATVCVLMLVGLLIGWARIWSGAHWPSDVLGGFAFGVMIVVISLLVLDHLPGERLRGDSHGASNRVTSVHTSRQSPSRTSRSRPRHGRP